MDNIDNIMQLCRLCLVKDQVNVPIFGGTNDIEEISSKISSCLPVKVSPDDSLPKKICDDCSYKLDLLYVFRNTSINSEKQLYQWLEQAGISKTTSGTISTTQSLTTPILATDSTIPSVPISTLDTVINDTITKSEISVKQEKTESTAGSELSAETQEYLLQQQKLPYQENFGDFNTTGTNSATAETEEPARKKPRRAAASKPPIKDNESDPDVPPTKAEDDSDEDIDDAGDGGGMDDDDDEEEEEDDGLDHPEFVDVPSTSAEEQPGPSGVNKDPIAAPFPREIDDNLVECSECSRILCKISWKRHLITHSDIYPYHCEICGKAFKQYRLLSLHQRVVHRSPKSADSRPYSCEVCKKSFQLRAYLIKHQKTHNNSESYECNTCHKNFKYYRSLIRHLKKHSRGYKRLCQICGNGFENMAELRAHMEKEHQILPFVCNICGKTYTNNYSLRCHMSKLHDQNIDKCLCKICNERFINLKRHMERIHNENRQTYICDLCGKEITSLSSLEEHRKAVHLGVKSLQCDTCGKKFVKKRTLLIHRRTHTGEKPYVCNICGKRFSQRSPLTIHLRTHSGEKPYRCNICDERFVSKSALDCHLKTKHQRL